MPDRRPHLAARAAFADGPVADDATGVAAERVLSAAHLHRDDTDTVRHG